MKNGSYAGRRSIRTGPVGAGHAPPVREAAVVPPIRCAAPFPLLRCPDVSLRGPKGAVAISGRHFQFVQGADKNAPTDCVCSGAHCAAVGGFAALRMRRPLYGERAPCEGPFNRARALVHRSTTLTWQSREGSCVFAGSALLSGRVLRDCTPRALPRASRSGRHVGLWPPRNDKSGAFAILTAVCTGCKCIAGPGCPIPYNAQTAALHDSGFSSKCI